MDTGLGSLPVRAYVERTPYDASLKWTLKGPTIDVPYGPDDDVFIILRHKVLPQSDGSSKAVPMRHPVRVLLTPFLMKWRPYVKRLTGPDLMYPPSSENWATRMVGASTMGLFVLQQTVDDERLWLTVLDREGAVHEAHLIEPYEAPVLEMEDDWLVLMKRWDEIHHGGALKAMADIRKLLDGPPPSWRDLALITRGAPVESVEIGASMRETLQRLVPSELGAQIREETMAALAWVVRRGQERGDPVEVFHKIGVTKWFRSLLFVFQWCAVEGINPPPVLGILHDAVREGGLSPWLSRSFSIKSAAELIAFDRIRASIPERAERVSRYSRNLTRREGVSLALPVTKKEAASSVERMQDRLALLAMGYHVRVLLIPQSVGLVGILSLSPAFRWPHEHMAWSAFLSGEIPSLRFIQYILVPPSAIETLKRELSNSFEVGWTGYVTNEALMYRRTGTWEFRKSRILRALGTERSRKDLVRLIGGASSRTVVHLDDEEVKALDVASNNLFLALTELEEFQRVYGFTSEHLEEILDRLYQKRVIDVSYRSSLHGLTSVLLHVTGEPGVVRSAVLALMRHSTSALGALSGDEREGVVILKARPEEAPYLLGDLPREAEKRGIRIRAARVAAYRSYLNSILTRIHRPDGTWKDDVSMVVRQRYRFRLRPKS